MNSDRLKRWLLTKTISSLNWFSERLLTWFLKTYLDDNRSHEKHSGDVVQECGYDSSDEAQNKDEDPLATGCQFAAEDGTEVEEATLGEDGHHQHHSKQEEQSLPVDPLKPGPDSINLNSLSNDFNFYRMLITYHVYKKNFNKNVHLLKFLICF